MNSESVGIALSDLAVGCLSCDGPLRRVHIGFGDRVVAECQLCECRYPLEGNGRTSIGPS